MPRPRPERTDYNPARDHLERVQDLAVLIREHKRIISMDARYPAACACGWTGSGVHLQDHSGHLARQIVAFQKQTDDTAHASPPSVESVRLHRAQGEDLCKACKAFLRTLQ